MYCDELGVDTDKEGLPGSGEILSPEPHVQALLPMEPVIMSLKGPFVCQLYLKREKQRRQHLMDFGQRYLRLLAMSSNDGNQCCETYVLPNTRTRPSAKRQEIAVHSPGVLL